MRKNKLHITILVIVMVIVLLGCKKYPENKWPILLVPPEKYLEHLVGARMIEYKRDGVSLMDSMNTIYKEIKISKYKFELRDTYGGSQSLYHVPRMEISYIGWSSNNNSELNFWVNMDNKKNELSYFGQIIKLTKYEIKSIKTENNHVYEIHFKK